MTSDEFAEDGSCRPLSVIGTDYSNGVVMNYTSGMCGFKYQMINDKPALGSVKAKLMKDSATTLLASSALAIAAVLSF